MEPVTSLLVFYGIVISILVLWFFIIRPHFIKRGKITHHQETGITLICIYLIFFPLLIPFTLIVIQILQNIAYIDYIIYCIFLYFTAPLETSLHIINYNLLTASHFFENISKVQSLVTAILFAAGFVSAAISTVVTALYLENAREKDKEEEEDWWYYYLQEDE